MRRFLFVALLLMGAGCQGLPARRGADCQSSDSSCDCRDRAKVSKKPGDEASDCKPPAAKKPADVPAPAEAGPPAAIAQDVLLVPKMVYIPYVAQSPTAPMRMNVGAPAPPAENLPPPQKTPVTTPPPPEDKSRRELERKCQELCERVILLEKCLRDRPASPPTVAPLCPPTVAAPICPPSRPILDFFRRPVTPRCDPLQPCEPICDTPAAQKENIQPPRPLPKD